MEFRWRADDGPCLVAFRTSPCHQLKKTKKNVVSVGPPLTKLSESAHVESISDEWTIPILGVSLELSVLVIVAYVVLGQGKFNNECPAASGTVSLCGFLVTVRVGVSLILIVIDDNSIASLSVFQSQCQSQGYFILIILMGFRVTVRVRIGLMLKNLMIISRGV